MENARTQLEELYARFGRGDLPGVLSLCDDAITFTVPGRSVVSGMWTKATFPQMIGAVMTVSGGTFAEELVDVLVGTGFAAAYLLHTFQRDGKAREYRTIHLWGLGDTQFTSWREYPEDLHTFESAWG